MAVHCQAHLIALVADDLAVLDQVKGELASYPYAAGRPFDFAVAYFADLIFLARVAAVDGKLDIHLTSVPKFLYSISLNV